MTKRITQQEIRKNLALFAPKKGELQNSKAKLTPGKRELDNSQVITRDFNTPTSIVIEYGNRKSVRT